MVHELGSLAKSRLDTFFERVNDIELHRSAHENTFDLHRCKQVEDLVQHILFRCLNIVVNVLEDEQY